MLAHETISEALKNRMPYSNYTPGKAKGEPWNLSAPIAKSWFLVRRHLSGRLDRECAMASLSVPRRISLFDRTWATTYTEKTSEVTRSQVRGGHSQEALDLTAHAAPRLTTPFPDVQNVHGLTRNMVAIFPKRPTRRTYIRYARFCPHAPHNCFHTHSRILDALRSALAS